MVRLQGGKGWQVLDYVREQQGNEQSPWFVPTDKKPLADSCLWRYLALADDQIDKDFSRSRKRLYRGHSAKLDFLYAKAVTSGELSVARAILHDLAELRGLLPDPNKEAKKLMAEIRQEIKEATERDRGRPGTPQTADTESNTGGSDEQ
jgi:hypothetical protein